MQKKKNTQHDVKVVSRHLFSNRLKKLLYIIESWIIFFYLGEVWNQIILQMKMKCGGGGENITNNAEDDGNQLWEPKSTLSNLLVKKTKSFNGFRIFCRATNK